MIIVTLWRQNVEVCQIKYDGRGIDFEGNREMAQDVMATMRRYFPNADEDALVRQVPSIYNGIVWAELEIVEA